MFGLSKNDWKCIGIGWAVLLVIALNGLAIFALIWRYADSTQEAVDLFIGGLFVLLFVALGVFIFTIIAGAIGSAILGSRKRRR